MNSLAQNNISYYIDKSDELCVFEIQNNLDENRLFEIFQEIEEKNQEIQTYKVVIDLSNEGIYPAELNNYAIQYQINKLKSLFTKRIAVLMNGESINVSKQLCGYFNQSGMNAKCFFDVVKAMYWIQN